MIPMRPSLAVPIRTGTPFKNNFGTNPFGMRGLNACDCGPVGGCGCSGGMAGLGDATTSLDSLINSAFGFLSGSVTGSLPSSAAVPPGASNLGSITQLLPYAIGGFVLYMLLKNR